MMQRKQNFLKGLCYILCGILLLGVGTVFAANPSGTTQMASGAIGTIANNVKSSFSALATFITALSYVTGFCFCLVGILKLKQHKDAPTQHPLSTGLIYLGLGILLIFLPSLMQTGAATIFGSQATAGGVNGVYTLGGKYTSNAK